MRSSARGTAASVRRRWLGWTAGLALGLVLAAQARSTAAAAAEPGDEPQECLAQAIYWEAGAEGREGMEAVAWVVLNRRTHPDFPATVCEVVREGGEQPGCQFKFWCDGKSEAPYDADLWAQAIAVAAESLDGRTTDPTGGALFFHAEALGAAPWEIPRERTAQIGQQIYYR